LIAVLSHGDICLSLLCKLHLRCMLFTLYSMDALIITIMQKQTTKLKPTLVNFNPLCLSIFPKLRKCFTFPLFRKFHESSLLSSILDSPWFRPSTSLAQILVSCLSCLPFSVVFSPGCTLHCQQNPLLLHCKSCYDDLLPKSLSGYSST
jgi:hypothetical protein